MYKLLIIYPQLKTPYSGGQVIDFMFVEELTNSKEIECFYLLDDNVPNPSILGYIKYTIFHLKKIYSNNIIFANSRYYPRLLLCFILLKLLNWKGKIIVYHHHFNYYTQKGIKRFLHYLGELTFLKIVDKIIIPSPYVKTIMKDVLPRKKFKYLEIGFDLKSQIHNKIKKNKLLYVGTIEERKRVHLLVGLAKFLIAQNINFHINVVGNLPDTAYVLKLKNKINEENLKEYISLKGRVEADALETMYSESDVFVFPSSHEGYGMVLVEALAHALPVVAFDNSAMPYTIKNSFNGLLAMENDVTDFYNKVFNLLLDERLWEKLRVNAYNYSLKVRKIYDMKHEMRMFIDNMVK